jgi:hypothetical protein
MTNPQHPITLPSEDMVQQWRDTWADKKFCCEMDDYIAVRAALWGADQELEACLLWVGDGRRENLSQVIALRNSRRPEPPSLKEQALKGFDTISEVVLEAYSETSVYEEYKKIADTVRQALEAL